MLHYIREYIKKYRHKVLDELANYLNILAKTRNLI